MSQHEKYRLGGRWVDEAEAVDRLRTAAQILNRSPFEVDRQRGRLASRQPHMVAARPELADEILTRAGAVRQLINETTR